MSEYTNNLNVVSTYKGEKSVSITGTFQCGIHFPKSGAKPFKVIERTSKNNKQYKQIACTIVISPDDRKNNNGNPFSSVYYDGKYLTFKEFLETTGVELIKSKLYAGVFMDRSTMGLYQVMGDPNLTFKQNIVLSGELSVYTDKEGKKRAAFGRVSLFAKDHVGADKVEKENANVMLESGGNAQASGGSPAAYASAAPAMNDDGFIDISDDDGELPF